MNITIADIKKLLAKSSLGERANELEANIPLKEQNVDSLDMLDFFLNIEETYNVNIPDEDIDKLKTLEDYEKYINGKLI
jgi:acyl carrier protein